MKFKKEQMFRSGSSFDIIGIMDFDNVGWSGESPKTTRISLFSLEEVVKILRAMNFDDVCITVSGSELPIFFHPSPEIKGMTFVVAPCKEDTED